MKNEKRKIFGGKSKYSQSGRRNIIGLIGLSLMMPLVACGQGGKEMQKGTVLNVVMYSYLARPIHNIVFNGTGLGLANSHGGTGIITGVNIPYGVQALKWTLGGPEGMARNGEKVKIKNSLVITPEQIPEGTRYLGLHLYPDDTAEVTFSELIPDTTARGDKILSASE